MRACIKRLLRYRYAIPVKLCGTKAKKTEDWRPHELWTVVSVNWSTKMVPKRPLVGKLAVLDVRRNGIYNVAWNGTDRYLVWCHRRKGRIIDWHVDWVIEHDSANRHIKVTQFINISLNVTNLRLNIVISWHFKHRRNTRRLKYVMWPVCPFHVHPMLS